MSRESQAMVVHSIIEGVFKMVLWWRFQVCKLWHATMDSLITYRRMWHKEHALQTYRWPSCINIYFWFASSTSNWHEFLSKLMNGCMYRQKHPSGSVEAQRNWGSFSARSRGLQQMKNGQAINTCFGKTTMEYVWTVYIHALNKYEHDG